MHDMDDTYQRIKIYIKLYSAIYIYIYIYQAFKYKYHMKKKKGLTIDRDNYLISSIF